jgi:hypothetical protein
MAIPADDVRDAETIRAIAREVAALLRAAPDTGERMLTAEQVAARYGVDRSWVYAHKAELGVVRIGSGSRPRLRFDPAVVAQRLRPDPAPVEQRRPVPVDPTRAPLLPIRSSRQRRTLDTG